MAKNIVIPSHTSWFNFPTTWDFLQLILEYTHGLSCNNNVTVRHERKDHMFGEMAACDVKHMQHVVDNRLHDAKPLIWLSSISKQKCNILIVNIIYMVIGLLLYCMKIIRWMHMLHAYLWLFVASCTFYCRSVFSLGVWQCL